MGRELRETRFALDKAQVEVVKLKLLLDGREDREVCLTWTRTFLILLTSWHCSPL